MRCCRCDAVAETDTSLLCEECGGIGVLPFGADDPPVTRQTVRKAAKLLNFDPPIVGKQRARILGPLFMLSRGMRLTKGIAYEFWDLFQGGSR